MLTLKTYFLVKMSQAEMQAFIVAAGISNYTLVGGDFNDDAHEILLQPQQGQSLNEDQQKALINVLPGGAAFWSIVDA